MTLLIISHTEHYFNEDGCIVGLGSTVREIDHLASSFTELIHIGCLYKNTSAPKSALPYTSNNVKFIAIPPYGGSGLKKLSVITNSLRILGKIRAQLRFADVFQFRAPTSMGLYVIPYLTMCTRKRGWYKYAGNWEQERPPISYYLQKWWLLNLQKRSITINGRWSGQPSKCVSFENPCLEDTDRAEGLVSLRKKKFLAPFTFCFVGRLESKKGLDRLVAALRKFPHPEMIKSVEIIGDGPKMEELKNISNSLPFPITIHGSLSRVELFEIYKRSHFIILPSDSEGFPKVIAEAANFGCIPIVSNISCIGQYINRKNGYLWTKKDGSFEDFFCEIDFSDNHDISKKAQYIYEMADMFTYEKYKKHLGELIFNER